MEGGNVMLRHRQCLLEQRGRQVRDLRLVLAILGNPAPIAELRGHDDRLHEAAPIA